MATRVAGKQRAMATKRAMVMKIRAVGYKEGNGKGSKSDGNGDEEGSSKEGGNGIFSFFNF